MVLTIFIFAAFAYYAIPAQAAVPTFDVGLNPKMDILLEDTNTMIGQLNTLLCMIAGIHQKEVGPPPVSTCASAGLGGSGGVQGRGGGLGGIIGNITSGLFGNILGGLGNIFGDLGNIFPSNLFDARGVIGGSLPDLVGLPSLNSVVGSITGIFGKCDSLDCIAWNISKAALSLFSNEIVNWVRTGGIDGTSLFVRDWERFLFDAGNEATELFLEEMSLTDACEPFSQEVKFSVANKVGILRQPFSERARCTMPSALDNFEDFYYDFSNGGWMRWLEITQVPQNNIHGWAYLAAEEELYQEEVAVETAEDEALASDGFIGQRVCQTTVDEINPDEDYAGGSYNYEDCQIVTPGELVENEMADVMDAEIQELNTADEMDEVLSVLEQQLLQGVIFSAGGLFSPTFTTPPPSTLPPPTPPTPPPGIPPPPPPPPSPITVTSAIYAENCGAPTSVNSVATQCNGLMSCVYTMNYLVDPGFDPSLGCAKDLTINYTCAAGGSKFEYIPPEAGIGGVANLSCP